MKITKINVYMIALITALLALLSAVIGAGFTESAIANADDNESGGIEAPIVTGAIAKIGDNEYDTFEEAVAALQDGDTLTVLHDFSIDENVTTSKNITFDLNGKKISTSQRGNPMLTFNGKTTVIDSSEDKTGEVAAWIDIKCTVAPSAGETYCSFVRGGIFSDMITFGSNTLITGGKYTRYASPSGTNVKIEGGEFVNDDDESSLSISSKELTISGGTFTAPVKVNVSPTSVHISGGTFSSFEVGSYSYNEEMDIQISGGTFGTISVGLYTYADFIKKGYIYTNASTGEYISAEQMPYNTAEVKVVECTSHVIEDGVCSRCGADCPHSHANTNDGGLLVCSDCGAEIAASIARGESTTLYFASLEDAFKAVQSGETITLKSKINCTNLNSTSYESIDSCTSVHVTTNCTLEYQADCYLNTGSSFYTLIVDEGVSLTFKDQDQQGLDRVDNRAKIKNNGEFTANGMFYEYFDNYGTLKGGHFYYKDDETTMVKNYGTIENSEFSSVVENYGTISGGTYYYTVTNVGADSKIIDGNMFAAIVNYGTIGKPNGTSNMDIDSVENRGIIYEGKINIVKNYGTIAGGTYKNEVTNTGCENEGAIIVGTISGGTFDCTVTNESYNAEHAKITGGKFTYLVTNNGTITNGTFSKDVTNNGIISGGTFDGAVTNTRFINGGTFSGDVYNQSKTVDEDTYHGEISDGIFNGTVYNSAIVTGGTFVKLKINSAQDSTDCYISGGTYTGNNSPTPNLEFFSSSSSTPSLPSTGGNSMLPSTGSDNLYLGKYLADGYAFFKIGDKTLGGKYYYLGVGLYDVYVAPHAHSFVEGKCDCGYECNHEGYWNVDEKGVCSNCGYHCKHSSWNEEYKCTVCGVACAHDWEGGTCDVCGKVCLHEGGTATCIVKATCAICGELYGDVDANGHHLEFISAVAATTVKQGCIEHYACTYCHKCFEDTLGMHEIAYEDTITPMIPSIVEGTNGEYVRESGSGLVFKSNADSKGFIEVSVDGIVIGEENYDKIDGGLVIALKTEYLESLSDGTHTISIVSTDGEATTNFTVEAALKEGLSAGAWAGIGIAIAVVVIGAVIGIIFAFKKRD